MVTMLMYIVLGVIALIILFKVGILDKIAESVASLFKKASQPTDDNHKLDEMSNNGNIKNGDLEDVMVNLIRRLGLQNKISSDYIKLLEDKVGRVLEFALKIMQQITLLTKDPMDDKIVAALMELVKTYKNNKVVRQSVLYHIAEHMNKTNEVNSSPEVENKEPNNIEDHSPDVQI